MLGRFFDNRLSLIAWARPVTNPNLIFGAKVNLAALTERLAPLIASVDPELKNVICLALLDDLGRPVALSHRGFSSNWKRPFAATEVGELLPHWETAVYLIDPTTSTRAARTLTLILSLVILTLVLAIAVGSWLLARDISRRLTLARQKTDFVSNVSHELKTPLTSIRMFAELLADGRVTAESKRKEYLEVITKEAARLTRMVDEVLDFARAERKERRYRREELDLARVTADTLAEYREGLEAAGLAVKVDTESVRVKGDPDALAQVLLNLLSNAEKYSARGGEVMVRSRKDNSSRPAAVWEVLDRGPGVPVGCEEKIFEQFYRADDALSSGVRGAGLGLTVARQIVRGHNGELTYAAREGGGSCFTVRLPLSDEHEK
jgi:signal transduction histidine kinase